MINVKTTENSIKLLTKDKYCDDDINVTFEGGSSGSEEVNELPVANAENVGKIYKYQGQLYECKEVVDLCSYINGSIEQLTNIFKINNTNYAIYLVDSEPNLEDMLITSEAQNTLFAYILNNGTNGWFNMEGTKLTFEEAMGETLNGVIDGYYCPDENKMYLVHYYENQAHSGDMLYAIIDNSELIDTIIIPKKIKKVRPYAFCDAIFKKIVFNGDIYKIENNSFVFTLFLSSIDLSNTRIVPVLNSLAFDSNNRLTEIKVPSALLEQFKTATNWSEYADYMVGV